MKSDAFDMTQHVGSNHETFVAKPSVLEKADRMGLRTFIENFERGNFPTYHCAGILGNPNSSTSTPS